MSYGGGGHYHRPLPSTWTHILTIYFSFFLQRYKPEYYSGDLLYYKLFYKEEGKIHELNCPAHITHQTLQLNAAEVNISAVTAAGSSPPASVSLIYTGENLFIISFILFLYFLVL